MNYFLQIDTFASFFYAEDVSFDIRVIYAVILRHDFFICVTANSICRFHTTILCFQIIWAISDSGRPNTSWSFTMLLLTSDVTNWLLYFCAAFSYRNAALEAASYVLVAVFAFVSINYLSSFVNS